MAVQETQYSLVARILHWLVAGLIISQYILAELAKNAEHNNNVVAQLALLANHKSIGLTVLALAVLRVGWRVFNQPAPLPETMPDWQHRVSNLVHWALYVLIFALPLSGWLMSSAFGYSVSWFSVFPIPDFLSINKSLAADLNNLHVILGNLLIGLAGLHVLAALKHHFIDKDKVLTRMASLFGWILLVGSIALIIALFGRTKAPVATQGSNQISSEVSTESNNSTDNDNASEGITAKASNLPIWQIDYEDSFIKFSGDQAGAPFRGEWQRWKATMQFDMQQLDVSQFVVEIDAASAFSNDQDRDDYIAGAEFFDAKNHQQVVFSAQSFTANGESEFVANAQLSVKGLTKPVEFTFSVESEGAQRVLLGAATLDRLSWNIGTGDWADPTWVGQEVEVSVRVVALVSK